VIHRSLSSLAVAAALYALEAAGAAQAAAAAVVEPANAARHRAATSEGKPAADVARPRRSKADRKREPRYGGRR